MLLPPLILSLKLDDASFQFFDRMRQKYFPPERNFLSAHLTLFHKLPGSELEKIENNLREICGSFEKFPLTFTGWRFLGKGTAMKIESNELLDLRTQLAEKWKEWLTPQDAQKFQPHITIQNKVAPEEAKETFHKLSVDWKEKKGTAKGILLWHYLGGHWKLEKEFVF